MTPSVPGGRRSHRQHGGDPDGSPALRAWRGIPIVVLLVAAGLIGWSTTRDAEPAVPPPESTALPLTRTDLTCPAVGATDLPAAKSGIGFTTPDGSAGAEPDDGAENPVEIVPLPKGKVSTPPDKPKPGRWQLVQQSADGSQPVVVSAAGPMAPGASAYTATVATDQAGGGLAVAECARAERETWFVGAGSTVDHASTLLVSNPGTTDAIVDITLLTSDGSVEPVRTSGLVVQPREVIRLGLSELAAGEGDTVVRVAASQGQVATAVLDNWVATLEPSGTEWIPAAQPPATSLTVGPLPKGADRRELVVGNPSDRSATVDIQVVGEDGTAPVQDFESLTVDAGSVDTVAVPDLLNDRTAVLALSADQPVVASVRSVSGGNPVDVAYGTSVADVTEPGVIPIDLPTVDPSSVGLTVTGADAEAETSLSIEAYGTNGSSLAKSTLTVSPGSAATWRAGRRRDLDADLDKVAYVVVRPSADTPFRAGVSFASDDAAWSSIPVRGAPTVVMAPGVYSLE